jgi:hypothetical protein
MVINSKIIESQLVFLSLEYDNIQVVNITKRLRTRIGNTKPLYSKLLNIFFFLTSLFRYIFFFVSPIVFYSGVFRFFNKLPSPFNLVAKLVRSYILLDYFEENEKL